MSSDLKEIEMEDIEEVAPDIDSGDAGNSLAVTEYVDEIYCFYRKTEVEFLVPSCEFICSYPVIKLRDLTTKFCKHRAPAVSLLIT